MTTFRLASRLRAAPRPAVSTTVSTVRRPIAAAAPMSTSAVPVPWRVVARSETGVVEIEHRGGDPLRAVRFSLAGGGLLGLSLPRTVLPGERLRVVLRGVSAEGALGSPDAMLVLRWFQADGTELLWPVAL